MSGADLDAAAVTVLDALADRPHLVDRPVPEIALALSRAGVRQPRAWRRRYRAVADAQHAAREIRAEVRALATGGRA